MRRGGMKRWLCALVAREDGLYVLENRLKVEAIR
jgi:hypothetical protein